MNNYNLKLTNTGNKANTGMPQFSLNYKPDKGQSNSNISYEILSKLKQDHDVVIEINTSLFIQTEKSINFLPEKFLAEIRNLNLEYSYKKVNASGNKGFLYSLLVGKKLDEGHEIIVYIPDIIWKSEAFRRILPDFGVRYYIMNKSGEGNKVLEEMNRMMDSEKVDYFEYIIFDITELNKMGIISNNRGFEEIMKALEIT